METARQETFEQLLKTLRESGDVLASSVLLEDAATGSAIPAGHLTKIRKWTQKDQDTEAIHTWPVLMIDDKPTRNMVIYTAESQRKSIKSWPGTTFLFNHKGTTPSSFFGSGSADHTLQAASQMARIYDAKPVKTPKGAIGSLAWFYSVEGIDDEVDSFIKKIEAGILREVSIHVSVPDGVICSICNDAFSNCEKNSGGYHYPGEKYGKEICYMSTGSGILIPLELSAVACPGSVNAHIMSDDEVEDYPVVSLREALGGSAEAINHIRQEITMKTEAEIAANRLKLQEAATAAGVTIAEFVGDEKNKTLVESADVTTETVATVFPPAAPVLDESAKCSSCSHKMHKGECGVAECECKEGKEAKKADADDDAPSDKSKQSHLFANEDCPVCGRGQETAPAAEPEAIAALRTEFMDKVKLVVAKSDAAVAEAVTRADEAEARSAERDALFDDVVSETVTLAITLGTKKEADRNAYRDHLATLSYPAVREIRETLRATNLTPEKRKEKLAESMTDRAKAALGSTQIETDKGGRRRATTTTRARFAASK